MFLRTSKFAIVIQSTLLSNRPIIVLNKFQTYCKSSLTRQSKTLLPLNLSNSNQTKYTMATSSSDDGASPPMHTNRLAQEKSPYLLQHAHNPVDWYPWGSEAIQKAKDENKLIFLSIGYSTCHWCHVMEKESFESNEIAKIMNHFFVNIKVDREERPDIDQIYMNFVLMINGSGGWPMSVWLTPDLAPITAGTYFPPTDQWGMPGFKTVLLNISKKWTDNGTELSQTGRKIIEAMRKSVSSGDRAEDEATSTTVEAKFDQAVKIYKRNADDLWGGFGTKPKFPEVSKLNFLLHAHGQKPEADTLSIVENTLKKIAEGGIHDHVFGGFARYSVDRKWHVPHFEKMLYDQGQLLMAYTNVYKATHEPIYLSIADDIFRYLTKDLQHPGGGFYSGEDADSLPTFADKDKIEGAFYAWTWQEIKDLFDENAGDKFQTDKAFDIYCHYYGVTENGNVEPASDPQGHLLGKNILMCRTTINETVTTFGVNKNVVENVLEFGNEILLNERNKRPRPHLDTKIITAWNGLVLSGLSKLACISNGGVGASAKREQSLEAAKRLVKFIRTNLYDEQKKTLMRTCYGTGTDSSEATMLKEPIQGFLDDYAFLIKGLLDYYLATLDLSALHWAKDLQSTQDKLFWDTKSFGYFYSMANASNVIVRMKEEHDGAEPCGNSVAASNLQLLGAYFEDESYRKKASKLFDYFGKSLNPFGYVLPEMMSALLLYDRGLTTIVVCGSKSDQQFCNEMIDITRNFYIPGLVVIHNEIGNCDLLKKVTAEQYKLIDNKPTVYICHNQECGLPIVSMDDLKNQLEAKYLLKH